MKEFINQLKIPTIFKAEHVTLPMPIRGILPDDKEKMLKQIDDLIEMAKSGKLDNFRDCVMGL